MNKEINLESYSNEESHSKSNSNDVIIVGAGVAGSALAFTLGKDGRQVQVIERNLNEPNRIVGELLQPAGYLKLLELGLDDCVRGIDAQKVFGYAFFNEGKSIRVPYPLDNYSSDVSGRSFHNGRFVQKLRQKAASLPNVKLVQGTATSLIEENGKIIGIHYKTRDGQESTTNAPLTIICDGCFSNFRDFLAKVPKITRPSHFAGFIMENCKLPYPNHGHVILEDPSSFVLYPISSKEVRFLIDFPGSKFPSISTGEMANFLKTVVASQVPKEIYNAFISSIDKAQMKVMPVSSMPAKPRLIAGGLLLGDALNMRHPITAGGMTVALNDIVILHQIFKGVNLYDTEKVLKYTEKFYKMRKPMAFTMNVMADSLYKLFGASSIGLRKEIRQACFDYVSLGNIISRGPVQLISGLNPHPWKMMLHLFALAIYIIGRKLFPVPSPTGLFASTRLALVATAMVIPIIFKENPMQVFFLMRY